MASRTNRARSRRRRRTPPGAPQAARRPAPDSPPASQNRRPRRRNAEPPDGHVAIGRVAGAWGIRGEVKIQPFADSPDRLAPGSEVRIDGGEDGETETAAAVVQSVRPHRAGLVARLSGIADRTAAENLAGALLTVPEDALAPLPEGVYYHFQLIGMAAFAEDGEPLGEIAEIIETPGNDVYIIRKEGERDLPIPALAEVVIEVDIPAARMVVRLLPGLR